MLLRTIGRARALLGCSRRTMPGKRIVVGVLCTVCLILGVYLKFYNHESADELLKANRVEVQEESLAKPNFHHLKSLKNSDEETRNEGGVKLHVQRETATEQHLQMDVQKGRTFGETKKDDSFNVGEFVDAKDKEGNEQEVGKTGGKDDVAPQLQDDVIMPDREQKVAEVPIERLDGIGDDNDKDDNRLRNAGGNAGERDREEETEDGHGGRGPHGIKIFDWDKWVKENDFVELGNIWGYCDDEKPPVIGKVLLLRDEDSGGLKNVLIFNTTMEYDIVMGRLEVSIDYNDVHFYSHTFDLESLEKEGDFFKSPITKGDHYYVREQYLSSLVPKGHYYGEARMIDQNEKVVICSTMHLTMK